VIITNDKNTLDFTYKLNTNSQVMCAISEYSGQDNNYRPTLLFTIFVQNIALAEAADKSCLQYLVNFARLFPQN